MRKIVSVADHVAGSIAKIVPLKKITRKDEVTWQTDLITHDGLIGRYIWNHGHGGQNQIQGLCEMHLERALKAFAAWSTNFNFEIIRAFREII